MAADWRKALSFSDRIAATSKMQNANPNESVSAASKYGKASEEEVRKYATSLHDYHDRCEKAAVELLQSLPPSHEQTLQANEHIDLPKTDHRIGRYYNVQHFQNGLFSEIYKATLTETNESDERPSVFALKIVTLAMTQPPHDAQREARILSAAKSEQVIPLLETFKQPGDRFIMVFPYMPFDLDTLLRGGQLTSKTRKAILRDMFSGLAHLHKLEIIHRDVKPSNILLSSPAGPAYISDFGIAWSPSDAASEGANEKIADVGTTCYRPPELLFGSSTYDTSLDLWAAGCVAAQVVCLNGKTLFDAGDLGSELALIKSMFETLGTPNPERWPVISPIYFSHWPSTMLTIIQEAASLPDWGKMNFREYPGMPWKEILPNAEPQDVDLVSKLVVFESGNRLPAEEGLKHPYLALDGT